MWSSALHNAWPGPWSEWSASGAVRRDGRGRDPLRSTRRTLGLAPLPRQQLVAAVISVVLPCRGCCGWLLRAGPRAGARADSGADQSDAGSPKPAFGAAPRPFVLVNVHGPLLASRQPAAVRCHPAQREPASTCRGGLRWDGHHASGLSNGNSQRSGPPERLWSAPSSVRLSRSEGVRVASAVPAPAARGACAAAAPQPASRRSDRRRRGHRTRSPRAAGASR